MIATRLQHYLQDQRASYRILDHEHTGSSMQTAEAARIPGDRLAKAVILEDADGPVMAVLPSDYHIDLGELKQRLQRNLDFADESELPAWFPDCEPGAVPPMGAAYGIPTIWDTRLGAEDTIYLEAGDHQTLLEMSGRAFHELMAKAERGHFTRHI
jgi:Ala-tRNA(Pro) deacylase